MPLAVQYGSGSLRVKYMTTSARPYRMASRYGYVGTRECANRGL